MFNFILNKKESLQIFFHLKALCQIKKIFELKGRLFYPSSVTEIVTDDWQGWCEAPNKKVYHNHEEHIRILIEPHTDKYYILINKTGVIYETGQFFLQILYEPKTSNMNFHIQNNIKKAIVQLIYNNKSLTDVTDVYIQNKSIKSDSVVVVCDRVAKIRVKCNSHTSVRARICEFDFDSNSRTYCWQLWRLSKGQKKCFSIDEYEFDEKEPEVYIRICHSIDGYEQDSINQAELSGWISAVSLRLVVFY